MTYNDGIMNELKHAIEVWRMNYLIEKGIDPQPNIASVVGKIEVTLDPVEAVTRIYDLDMKLLKNPFDRGEEE